MNTDKITITLNNHEHGADINVRVEGLSALEAIGLLEIAKTDIIQHKRENANLSNPKID